MRCFKAGCRPIICLDGCHLKGHYGGHLLAAVGMDADNCLYPIAFAIMEAETESSWCWFMKILKTDLELNNSHHITFMTDKQKMIVEARDKAIITLVELIRSKLMQKIAKKMDQAEKLTGPLCPKIQKKLDTALSLSHRCWPVRAGGAMYQVSCGPQDQHSVNMKTSACSCRRCQLTGISCTHAIFVILYLEDRLENYVDPCYSVSTQKVIYSYFINLVRGENQWSLQQTHLQVLPPVLRRPPGRPHKKHRRREADEAPQGTKIRRGSGANEHQDTVTTSN
ncbi:hypothetical protein V6N13_113499 [Hibiscus sabdariffa]